MNVAARPGMTLEEFLAWEEGQEDRWEFDGFAPVAMVGGTSAHSRLTVRLTGALDRRLGPGPCAAYNDSLSIIVAGSLRYPDAFVSCSPIAANATVAEHPVVVFEVLSPSTSTTDQIVTNAEYRATASIQRYVMLAQDRIGATVFERQGDGWVGVLISGVGAVLEMPEIGISIPLSELYQGLIEPA